MTIKVFYLEELDQLVTVRKAFDSFGNFEYNVIEKGYDPVLDVWSTINTPEFYGFEYIGEL